MRPFRSRRGASAAVGLALITGAPALAQVGGVLQSRGGGRGDHAAPANPMRIELTVSPASEPDRRSGPSLRCPPGRLLDQNAAIFWLQSLQLLGSLSPEEIEEISTLRDGPFGQGEQARAAQLVHKHLHEAFALMQLASCCRNCDWQTPVERIGESTVFPELGRLRGAGRSLVLKARVATARGDYAETLAVLRVVIAMARHAATGPTMIQSLVGYAIMDQAAWEIDAMLRSPGAPSLYWALAELGTPVFDFQHALDAERRTFEQVFPQMAEIDSGAMPPAEALAAWKAFTVKYSQWTTGGPGGSDFSSAMAAVSHTVQVFPAASGYLRSTGMSQAQIDSLPVSYVSLRYLLAEQLSWNESMFRWASLPYWQAMRGIAAAEERLNSSAVLLRLPPLDMFTPALGNNLSAHARIERRLALLRCIEALRLYAGANGGKLPATLDETQSIAPCPLDPATGKAFDYRLEGGIATLSGWTHPRLHITLGFEYVLQIRREEGTGK